MDKLLEKEYMTYKHRFFASKDKNEDGKVTADEMEKGKHEECAQN